MTEPKHKITYAQVDEGQYRFYVRHKGFYIGMVWRNGGAWQGSRYNSMPPEVKGDTRKQAAERLVELVQKSEAA